MEFALTFHGTDQQVNRFLVSRGDTTLAILSGTISLESVKFGFLRCFNTTQILKLTEGGTERREKRENILNILSLKEINRCPVNV